jgi:hypothetical protein
MRIEDITGRKLPQIKVEPDPARPHPSCSVGIEVELEGIRFAKSFGNLWIISSDGSLQNGIELISVPVWGTAITDALSELDTALKGKTPYLSFRTSVHVHLNVLDLSTDELAWLVKLYLFYEPALFRLHNDWSRYENIFCVPARKSLKIQEGYASLLHDLKRERLNTREGTYVASKYAALNPNPVSSLGTLEFRHMGGCIDTKRISDWINILLQLKVAAINKAQLDNPSRVFGALREQLTIRDSDIEDGWNMMEFITYRGNV